MDPDYLKIGVTISLAIGGWLIVNSLNAKRDLRSKRRDLSLDHLISAYRVLANEISHRELNASRNALLENILTDIQLFGASEQVELAKELAAEVASKRSFELDPLINSLRDDLRSQLRLEPIVGNLRWLRMAEPSSDSGASRPTLPIEEDDDSS